MTRSFILPDGVAGGRGGACVLACSITIQRFGHSIICDLIWEQG